MSKAIIYHQMIQRGNKAIRINVYRFRLLQIGEKMAMISAVKRKYQEG